MGCSNSNLIVFEGPGGSGKSTVRERTKRRLEREGYSVKSIGEFSETEYGRRLEEYITKMNVDPDASHPLVDEAAAGETGLSTVLAQLNDVALAVERDIVPALSEYDYVLKERLLPSCMVLEPMIYEESYGEVAVIEDLVAAFGDALLVDPDLTIYLDVSRDERTARLSQIADEGSNFGDGFERVERRFRRLEDEMHSISNEGDVEDTVAEVTTAILDATR